MKQVYKATIDDVWYFAPKPQSYEPNGEHMVICLIWTPPYKIPLIDDWTAEVAFTFCLK